MGLSIASRLKAQLKRPAMSSQPKKALHNSLNNVTNVKESEKKPKKGLSNKRKPTGEGKLFEELKYERCDKNGIVVCKHIDEKTGKECTKPIHIDLLRPENFSHIKAKGMHKSLRLVKSNIEIVSKAYHFFHTHKQILREVYKN